MSAFLLGIYIEIEFLDNRVAICLSLSETAKELSKVKLPFYTHVTMYESFNCFTSSQNVHFQSSILTIPMA